MTPLYPLALYYLDIIIIINKKLRGINPMGLSAPWTISYSNNCLGTQNCHYQTFYSKTFFHFDSKFFPVKKIYNNKPLENMSRLMMMFTIYFLKM